MKGYRPKIQIPKYKYYDYLLKILKDVDSLQQDGSKFTFRCPLCGDSETNRFKKRGFLLTDDEDGSTMGCQNCGHRNSFSYTLKESFPKVYDQWMMDVYFSNSVDRFNIEPVIKEIPKIHYEYFKPVNVKSNIVVEELVRRKAVAFIKKRRIPLHIAKTLLYCAEYPENKFVNRIIFPHYLKDGTYEYFEGRDLSDSKYALRYKYPKGIPQSHYNMAHINKNKDFFIFEGTVDSYFINNSMACGGSDKLGHVLSLIDKKYHKNLILVFDCDLTGILAAHKMIKRGYRVFMWTSDMFKHNVDNKLDMNLLITSGYFDDDLDDKGQVRYDVIMKHVLTPTLQNVLEFELNCLSLGFDVNGGFNDRSFQKRR